MIINGDVIPMSKTDTNLVDSSLWGGLASDVWGATSVPSNSYNPFSASGQTHLITILATDGSILFSGETTRSSKQKKATHGQLKAEFGVNFDSLAAASTLEDDDELVLNDFSGGEGVELTAAALSAGSSRIGWGKPTSGSTLSGGSLNVDIPDSLIRIYTREDRSQIEVHVVAGSKAVGSIFVNGVKTILTASGGSSLETFYTATSYTGEYFEAGETYNVRILNTDGTILLDGTPRSAQKKKVTWAKLKGDIDASTNFAELEKVTTLEDDDEFPINDFSGGSADANLTAGKVYTSGAGIFGWSVADGSHAFFVKGGSFDVPVPDGLIAIDAGIDFLEIHVKTGTFTNLGSIVIDGVSHPVNKTGTNLDGVGRWGEFNYDKYKNSNAFSTAFVNRQVYNIKLLATDGSVLLGNDGDRLGEQKKTTLGQVVTYLRSVLGFVGKSQTILTPEYLKARPNLARDEIRIDSTGTGTLGIGTDTFVDTDLPSTAYQSISIAVLKTDMADAKYIEVFHAHAPQVLATSSGLRELAQFDATAKPFSGTFRSDRNYTMEIHASQNQLGGHSSTTDRITFTANTTGGSVYIGEVRIWK